jgi:hypothetical protein
MQLQHMPEDVQVSRFLLTKNADDRVRGIFHLRLKSAPDDFLLLSPTDPEAEDSGMTCYNTPQKKSSWWFCKTCGVRCFTSRAPSEVLIVELPLESLKRLEISTEETIGGTAAVFAWKMKKEGFREHPHGNNYFSVNAVTLDNHQKGLNRAAWHENKWVHYVDNVGEFKGFRPGEPFPEGIY